jgi:hypothetical protein
MAAANVEIDAEDDDVGHTVSHLFNDSVTRIRADTSYEFNQRQRAHFENLLHEKWECSREGHAVCVPTDDGQHFQLSEHNIRHWVEALVSP